MKPVVHGLEDQFGDQIRFAYIDVDDPASSQLKSELGYTKQPEMYVVDGDGNVVEEWSGFVEQDVLVAALSSLN